MLECLWHKIARRRAVLLAVALVLVVIEAEVLATEAPEVEWERILENTIGFSVEETTDGGYILIGATSNAIDGGDTRLIKTDAEGNLEWEKTFTQGESSHGFFVQQTGDGGYILTGMVVSSTSNVDVWLIKTDSKGNTEWNKTYDKGFVDLGVCVRQTADGGYILVGGTNSDGTNCDVWMIKVDNAGNMEWDKTFGESKDDLATFVEQTTDGGYIMVGGKSVQMDYSSLHYVSGSAWLIKTDSKGNMEWDRVFSENDFDISLSVQPTADEGYIMVGATGSYGAFGSGSKDVWLIKTDATGNKKWEKTFGGSEDDAGFCVQETRDGGYILIGYKCRYGTGQEDIWLIKTDATGNKEWERSFGKDGIGYIGFFVQQTKNGGYVVIGGGVNDSIIESYLIKLKPVTANNPPNTEIIDASVSDNTVTFTWTGSDDTTPTKDLLYSYRLVRPGPLYDEWSSWDKGTTKTYSGLTPGNYKFEVRAKDADGAVDPSPASKDFVMEETENHPPIARASDISNQPQAMYPDTVYTVTAKYFDPDGRDNLKICYLQLKHPQKRLTMMWYQEDGHTSTYAGEEGENYLTKVEATATEITDPDGTQGYEIKWTFMINNKWPEVQNAIDFGVFASDDEELTSGWDYDGTGASFVLRFFNPELSIPVCAPMMQDAHLGTTLTFAFTVQNNGNQTDTINLSFEDQFNWDISLSTSSVTLAPKESYTGYLLVTVSDHAVDRISITGKSVGDSSKSSSCVIRASGHDNVALFMVKATFRNSTAKVRTLRFEIPEYVKMSEQSITLNPNSTATVAMLFDPGRQDARFHGFELKIDDLQTGSRVIIETNFNTDKIIATNFHMSPYV